MTIAKTTLPAGWRWVKLGQVGRFESGGTPPKNVPEFWGGSIPFVTGADITNLYIISNNARAFLTEAGLHSGRTSVCKPGTVLFVTRTRVGRIGIANEVMGASQDLSPFSCGEKVIPEFVCRYLQSISNYLLENCRGAIIQGLTKDFIESLEIPLPPLAEQQRIAEQLNEQMTAFSQARQAAEEQLRTALELPSAYLRDVFGNSKVQKCSKQRLGDILNLRKEIIHPYDKPQGQSIFVGLEHIESHTGNRLGSIDIEMSKLTGRKPKFYKGDIVYGYLRPYLNKVWLAEFDGLCSVDQYVYRVDADKADANFVSWFMRSPIYLERAPIDTTPGQLPRIRTEEVASVEINLPPLDEQKNIATEITERLKNTKNLKQSLEIQLAEINQLPSALLRQAFVSQN